MKKMTGFTLMELAIVVAILAILAVVAIPAYTNLEKAANRAQAQSFAASFTSSSVANYVAKKTEVGGVDMGTCADFAANAQNLMKTQLPTDQIYFSTETTGSGAATAGDLFYCTITYGTGAVSATSDVAIMASSGVVTVV